MSSSEKSIVPSTSALRVAIVGAGPAGIYAADILSKSVDASIDLFEQLPAPYGLVRYGVAPDHPRIKGIILALYKVLQRGDIRLLGNVEYGRDITMEDLETHYDAVIFATGAIRDAELNIPGVDLPGSYGAADFVSWYDGHPDSPRTWPLEAEKVAVIGNGNVALDVARVLAKDVEDMLSTEIPANVEADLRTNPITDVHIIGRRGPAQAKFSPLELRELGQVPGVDVIVYDEDFEFDEGSENALESSNITRQVVKTLTDWTLRKPQGHPRRVHLHFLHNPVEILGQDRVQGLRTERTTLTGDGNVKGTGTFHEFDVQAVYRAVGYFGSPLVHVPFDPVRGVIPNEAGRIIDNNQSKPRAYATGWIKRGPVGLIGSTKSDAAETVRSLLEDFDAGYRPAPVREDEAILELLDQRGVRYTTWQGWERLDAYERALGEAAGRERIKVVPREDMTRISLAEKAANISN